MRWILWALAVVALLGNVAAGDVNDLSGGVMITHAPPGYTYTSDGLDYYGDYQTTYGIDACGEQVTRIDDVEAVSIWYVVAAWTEEKDWKGFEFGFGDYAGETMYGFLEFGICTPPGVNALAIYNDEPTWPGPNNGVSVTATLGNWSGNFDPIYYFAGYAYATGVIPLDVTPKTGFVALLPLSGSSAYLDPETDLGSMGILADGVERCPGSAEPTGACCSEFGGECTVLTAADCTAAGGTYEGDDTVCSPNPCDVLWACCLDGGTTCTMLTADDCATLSGYWHEGDICSADGGTFDCIPGDPDDASWGEVKSLYRDR